MLFKQPRLTSLQNKVVQVFDFIAAPLVRLKKRKLRAGVCVTFWSSGGVAMVRNHGDWRRVGSG